MSKENPRLIDLIEDLRSKEDENNGSVWKEVASRLDSPRRTHAEVNVGKIERYADEEETVVVPGKVLGSGVISKGVKVAAFDFSASAREKIEGAKGESLLLEDYLEENPDGGSVRVIR